MPEGVVNIFNAICFIDYYPNLVSFIVFFMAYSWTLLSRARTLVIASDDRASSEYILHLMLCVTILESSRVPFEH